MPISWRVREADCRSGLVVPSDYGNDRTIVRADSPFFSPLRNEAAR